MKFIIGFIWLSVVMFRCSPDQQSKLLGANSNLKIGSEPAPSRLALHKADTFKLDLAADAFVYGYADQITVDVVVDVFGPDSVRLATFDNPARGPEDYSFVTTKPGIHRIVVSPFKDLEGEYKMMLSGVEPVAKEPAARIDQLMRIMVPENAPGASIAAMKDGKVIYSKAFGYANVEQEAKNTPQTIFHVASVSKQFTAFAIALLIEEGKLSLNDDIRKYLPEVHDFGTPITINHLLHHTSGLRDQWSLLSMAGWRLDDVITQKQILRVVSRQRELNFKPGEEMLYCNTGFTLLAEIVTRVTGEPFPEWTRTNIFEPLQMTNSFFYDDHQRIVKHRAYSYNLDGNGELKKSVLSYANYGATSLFTTAEDLLKWAQNFESVKVGNQNVMALMDRRFVLNNGDTIIYAFGQNLDKYKGLRTKSHSGGDAGYRSFLLRFPDQHFAVSVACNNGSINPGAISYAIADLYLADQFIPEKTQASVSPPAARLKAREPFDASQVKLAEYTGKFYSPELETSYTIAVRNDTLVAHHQRHDDLRLRPAAADVFEAEWLGTISFNRNAARKITGMKLSNGRARNVAFEKE